MSGTQELAARQIREILRVLPKGRSLKDARIRAALMVSVEQLEEQERNNFIIAMEQEQARDNFVVAVDQIYQQVFEPEPIPGVPATNERA